MQILKSGKEEIVYLLTKAIEKYKFETGQEIIQNTNRKNYEVLAILLSEISNQLPFRWEAFGTEAYSEDSSKTPQEYPYRKYDITGGQIKDALNGIVSHPRPFLIDACYVYLFNVGRKSFEKNVIDENLLVKSVNATTEQAIVAENNNINYEQQIFAFQNQYKSKVNKLKIGWGLAAIFCVSSVVLFQNLNSSKKNWQTIKQDMNLLSYQPTKFEIDSLEGVWLCYTGSPQARISDPLRYHKVVPNLVAIQYKNGYFTFERYGASFDHIGYMQFESPGIVSVYSRVKTNSNNTESPRHSLLNLYTSSKYLAAISSSWNFDIGDKNKIIGIREIFIKMGKGGSIVEVMNEIENASCNCKVIRWQQPNHTVKTFYLKNELLDSLRLSELKPLIDENSILQNIPKDSLVLPNYISKSN